MMMVGRHAASPCPAWRQASGRAGGRRDVCVVKKGRGWKVVRCVDLKARDKQA